MNWRRIGSLLIVFGFLVTQGCNCSNRVGSEKVKKKEVKDDFHTSSKKEVGTLMERNKQKPQVRISDNSTMVQFYSTQGSLIEEIDLNNENPWADRFYGSKVKLDEQGALSINIADINLTKEQAELLYLEDRDPNFTKVKGVVALEVFLRGKEINILDNSIVANYYMYGYNKLDQIVSTRSIFGIFKLEKGSVLRKFVDLKADARYFKIAPNSSKIFFVGGDDLNENGENITESRIYQLNLKTEEVKLLMEGKRGQSFSPIAFDPPHWIRFQKSDDFTEDRIKELFIVNTTSDVLRSYRITDKEHPPQRIVNGKLQLWQAPSIEVKDLKIIK